MFHPANSSATVHQSKPMPRWLWLVIAKSLGIKTRPDERPILATVLHAFTLATVLAYFITCTWFTVYDIEATTTKFDVLNGSVTVIVAAGFCCETVYANLLAFKLFTHSVFRQSLRLHAKTVLKVNAAFLLALLSLLFIGLYSYVSYVSDFGGRPCWEVKLSLVICYIRYPSQLALSIISFLWNLMVAVVCMSVCRTHTIGIRHFLMELDDDALVLDGLSRQHKQSVSSIDGPSLSAGHPTEARTAPHQADGSYFSIQEDLDLLRIEAAWDRSELERRRHRGLSASYAAISEDEEGQVERELPQRAADGSPSPRLNRHGGHRESVTSGFVHTPAVKPLTNREILDRYWRLQCRLNTTSSILQRWLTSWIILIVLWSLYYLMYWIDHDAGIADMIIFFIPLFLLPLLCSGPIEVNGEGERVSKMICPTEERMQIIMFIRQAPLSFTIYGFVLNYSTIVTAILAIAVAFSTKIIVGNLNMDGMVSTPAPAMG